MRLNRFLAAAGIGSRRHCDELIAAGRVTINGRVCIDFSAQPAEGDHVKVGGKLVRSERPLYIVSDIAGHAGGHPHLGHVAHEAETMAASETPGGNGSRPIA